MSEEIERRSFEFVNYMLRPKKQIERKVIIDILRELNNVINISNYKYIGFGSIYYYDFILFHKFLKMNDLLSIDYKSTKKRFEFNRPYDFISLENKISTDFLSEFDWMGHKNAVLWLDYDSKLDDVVLSDLEIISKNCNKKDILIITLNASCAKDKYRRKLDRELFFRDFGTYVSSGYENRECFTPKNLPKLLQNVIMNYLSKMCELRDTKFYKLFSFVYRDTSPMFTLGGIFDDKNELRIRVWTNEFICTDEEIKYINVPILTYYEKFYIDSHIEKLKQKISEIEDEINGQGISDPEEKENKMTEKINTYLPFELHSIYDLKNYLDYYKYYPQYYEGII
jgi:hypothetical protein